MIAPPQARPARRTGFRLRLWIAMMVVVMAISSAGLYVAQRNLASEVSREMQRQFEADLTALHNLQDVRHAALAERCRALVRRPRIHAALEDNALDLLYPVAEDELRDTIDSGGCAPGASTVLRAEFYRFLNLVGTVIRPQTNSAVGPLSPDEESALALSEVPHQQQIGYLTRRSAGTATAATEIIAVPIVSTETGESIGALVLGFKPVELIRHPARDRLESGVWARGRLHLPSRPDEVQSALGDKLAQALGFLSDVEATLEVEIEGTPHRLFAKRLNPGSLYPPAYEVCLFSLADLATRQSQARWRILGAGGIMLLVGFAASHYFSDRLSVPVERLAVDSEVNRAGRERAETALQQTSEELQRSVRFSSDASHQLKTPVTVLRAGLDELLSRDELAPEIREEISQLIHQTYRLTGVIEDLLLLSRMDAGRLSLAFEPVDLSQILEVELDDLGALPDQHQLVIDQEFPATLVIAGERRYTTLIVRNLLENARKYNRRHGRVLVAAATTGGRVRLRIGNNGTPIPTEAQEHIFERFHRGAVGENIPGHGLGLNLARELARLHGGELRLLRSQDDWTEFEVTFRAADPRKDLT
ncbi:MAG: HAMP domain-containing histidine kinase [Verrucomicrobiales bacterium]|nr:HAMP domain-containing histidine kinase [Verrucomicrobiales bacterium]